MELPFGGFLLEQRVGDFLGMQTSLLRDTRQLGAGKRTFSLSGEYR